MAKINLSPYTIKIKKKYSTKNEDISDLFGTKISLYDVISNLSLKFKQKPYKQSKNQKALKFENKMYLFSWDKIPGNDNVRLIEFLNRNFAIEWVKTAEIEKIDGDRAIKVSTGKNFISLSLNDEKTKVYLEIDDVGTYEFIAKTENSNLNIYNKIKTNSNNRVKILQDIIFYGEYGRILKLMDTDTGIMDKIQIDPNKSPVIDFTFTYFEDSLIKTQGYIIAQNYSNNGYKTIFHNLLKEEINDRFGIDSTVEINPIISSEIIDLIKKGGRIFDITLISHDISKDSTDHLLSDSSKNCLIIENTNEISFSLSSSRGKNLINTDKIEDLINSLKNMILNSAETPFYEMTKSRLDEIKIKIKTKNKEHTVGISLDDLEFKEIRPLDDEDVILKDGTIAINYILKEARDYSTEIVDKYRQVS